jgi:hypothetical protein
MPTIIDIVIVYIDYLLLLSYAGRDSCDCESVAQCDSRVYRIVF